VEFIALRGDLDAAAKGNELHFNPLLSKKPCLCAMSKSA